MDDLIMESSNPTGPETNITQVDKGSNNVKILQRLSIVLSVLVVIYLSITLLGSLLSKKPSQEVKDVAASIPKYPNSSNWKLKNTNVNCLMAFDGCWGAKVNIKFSTSDGKEDVDNFYVDRLTRPEWETDGHDGGSGVIRFNKVNSKCNVGVYLNHRGSDTGNYEIDVLCAEDH